MVQKSRLKLILFLFFTMALTGCGGGGGSQPGSGGGGGLPPAVYVNNDLANANSVSGWNVDVATGELTLMPSSPFATGDAGSRFGGDGRLLVLHEATRRLFATGSDTSIPAQGSVSVFDIDPATGELTLVPGSPFPTGGLRTFGIDVTSDGSRIVAANVGNGSVADPGNPSTFITVMDVAADGTLTHVTGSPFASAVTSSIDIPMISSDDRNLYVNTEDSEFLGFELNADGSLTGLSGTPYFTGANTRSFGSRLRPNDQNIYFAEYGLNGQFANGTLGVLVYRLDSSGVATVSPNSPVPVEFPNGMAFNSDGSRLYVAQFDPNKDGTENKLYLFDVDANGDLTMASGSPFSLTVSQMSSIEISTDDRFLFVVDEGGSAVNVYSIDAAGAPTEVSGSPFENAAAPSSLGGHGASGLAVTPW